MIMTALCPRVRWSFVVGIGLLVLGSPAVARAGGIGNLVFRDQNQNRFYDLGDVPVAGVDLQLFVEGREPGVDEPVALTVTDGAGRYLFNGLPDGRYFVFIPDAEFRSGGALINTRSVPGTLGGAGADDDAGENGIDSAQPTSQGVRSGIVVFTAGQAPVSFESETGDNNESDDTADADTDLTVDFGFTGFSTRVGDFVWRDDNRNGRQDTGEPGLPNVEAQLFTSADEFVGAVLTAADGFYTFAGLTPGSYYVRFPTTVFPLKLTLAEQDPADAVDSDAAVATGRTPVFTLSHLENLMNKDAGYVVDRSEVGDHVFEDADADGIQDAGEQGIDGLTVRLYTSGGALVGETQSADGGYYRFLEVSPGDYFLSFPSTVSGLILTGADAGGDDTNDSDPDAVTGATPVFTVLAGLDDITWDAGYHMPPSRIRGTAWRDLNKNGVWDADDPVLGGVAISLRDGVTDEVVDNALTAADGTYDFPNLTSRAWKLEFSTLAGIDQRYQLTVQDAGGDDRVDSDPLPNNGRTAQLLPVNGETLVVDAGYKDVRLGIGNGVFIDYNGNGIFGTGEGVAGVEIQLFNAGNDPLGGGALRITTTSPSGIYSFFDLSPGQYFVFIPSSQFATGGPLAGNVSLSGNGSDDGADDNAGENGNDAPYPAAFGIRSNVVTLSTGNEPVSGTGSETGRSNTLDGTSDDNNIDLTVDFGFKPGMTLGNLVFSDTNNDGRYTVGEGVAGVAVELYAGAAQPGVDIPSGSLATGEGGFYQFRGVTAGSYTVHLPAMNFQRRGVLAGQKSLTGNGTSAFLDDNADENGIDAANPAVTGISAPLFSLMEGAAPVQADGETGAGSADDDALDANGFLTVDFGLLPGLPDSYGAWRERFLPSGSNGPTQDADGDGIANAGEYLYHLPPSGGIAAQHPLTLTADPDTGKLAAVLVFNPIAADAAPMLAGRADLRDGSGSWESLTGITPVDVILPDGRLQRTWQDLELAAGLSGGTGFIRATASLDIDGDAQPDFTFHTPVLGWRERLHHAGKATAGTAFIRPALFRGTVDSAAGLELTLATAATGGNLGSLFPPAIPCYAEISGGPWVGHRFEIDGSATSGAVLRLLADSPLHTRTLPDLTGAPLVVRPHWTLATLFPPDQFRATTSSTTSDQVLTFSRPSFVGYWLLDLGTSSRWVRTDDSSLADRGNLPIPPGEGLFVDRRDGALSVLDLGEVRPHAMARLLPAGYTMHTSGWPLPATPVTAALLQSDGFTGSTNPSKADAFQLWSADSGTGPQTFRSFFLLHGPAPYRYWVDKSDASLQNRNAEMLFAPGRAFFLQLRATVADSLQPCPWTP